MRYVLPPSFQAPRDVAGRQEYAATAAGQRTSSQNAVLSRGTPSSQPPAVSSLQLASHRGDTPADNQQRTPSHFSFHSIIQLLDNANLLESRSSSSLPTSQESGSVLFNPKSPSISLSNASATRVTSPPSFDHRSIVQPDVSIPRVSSPPSLDPNTMLPISPSDLSPIRVSTPASFDHQPSPNIVAPVPQPHPYVTPRFTDPSVFYRNMPPILPRDETRSSRANKRSKTTESLDGSSQNSRPGSPSDIDIRDLSTNLGYLGLKELPTLQVPLERRAPPSLVAYVAHAVDQFLTVSRAKDMRDVNEKTRMQVFYAVSVTFFVLNY